MLDHSSRCKTSNPETCFELCTSELYIMAAWYLDRVIVRTMEGFHLTYTYTVWFLCVYGYIIILEYGNIMRDQHQRVEKKPHHSPHYSSHLCKIDWSTDPSRVSIILRISPKINLHLTQGKQQLTRASIFVHCLAVSGSVRQLNSMGVSAYVKKTVVALTVWQVSGL